MTACPTCGHAWRNDGRISIDLDTNTFVSDGVAMKVEAQVAEILVPLIECSPRVVEHDVLIETLYGEGWNRPEEPMTVIRVRICELRKHLAKTAYRVLPVWGRGYKLVRHEPA